MPTEHQPAKLDNYDLDIESIGDAFDKSLAQVEYPFADGASLEDMGANARPVRFRCYFLNEKYALHKEFMAYVLGNRICELRHPAYGLLKGRVKHIAVRHDDRINTAELDVDFIEQKHGDDLAKFQTSVVSETEASFRDGQASLMDKFKAVVASVLGAAEGATVVNAVLADGQSAVSQIAGLSRIARTYLGVIDSTVNTVDALLSSVPNPVESIIATVDYGTSLPGRVVGAVARAVERQSQAIEAIVSSPSEYAANMVAAIDDLRSAVPDFAVYFAGAGALHGAVVLGAEYQEDETNRRTAIALEATPAFSVEGDLVRTDAAPSVATIDALERSLEAMRTCIQTAIDLDRTNQSLRDTAQALLRHVNSVKLERERLRIVTVTSSTPLHMVCHRYGLSLGSAQRILAMNRGIANPTFVQGELQIYAR